MAFKKYRQKNLAAGELDADLGASGTLVVLKAGQGALFPSTFPFSVKIEEYDTQGRVTKRNMAECTALTGDVLTVTRSTEACPASFDAVTQTTTALAFASGSSVFQVTSAAQIDDIQDEVSRLETEKLNKTGGAMSGALLLAEGANIASAATVDLSTATGNSLTVTGTTNITSFGTVQAGATFVLTFSEVLTLTHNATSLILPSSANVTTAAGDTAVLVSLGSGNWKCASYNRQSGNPVVTATATVTGEIRMWSARTAPAGFLLCDGSAVSRTTYANLFNVVNPTLGTFTVTIATPAVATLASHGMRTGDSVYLTTTGALPTGLAQNTRYWVIRVDANTFNFATSLANALSGTKINTSGTQSGTHTARLTPYGIGDGSTTFNLPSMAGKVAVGLNSSDTEFAGLGQTGGAKTHTLQTSEIPGHTHGQRGPNSAQSGSEPMILVNAAGAVTGTQLTVNSSGSTNKTQVFTDSAGSGGAHNNVQPYVAVNYIIAT